MSEPMIYFVCYKVSLFLFQSVFNSCLPLFIGQSENGSLMIFLSSGKSCCWKSWLIWCIWKVLSFKAISSLFFIFHTIFASWIFNFADYRIILFGIKTVHSLKLTVATQKVPGIKLDARVRCINFHFSSGQTKNFH